MTRTLLLSLLAGVVACASRPEGPGVASPSAPPAPAGEVAPLSPAGPQSFTPEVKPKERPRLVKQRWVAKVGSTDHRTTMIAAGGALYIGTRGAGAGVHVLDGATGQRRPSLPAAKGDVVGIAMEADRIYSSSSSGEVVAATIGGALVFRASIGAPVATPPTLVDVDGDGAVEVAVGDAKGRVSVLDGKTGKVRWQQALSRPDDAHPSVGAGLAAADLDGDGKPEIVAGTESGKLVALRVDGARAWTVERNSALRAAPILCDVDADKQLEVIIGWADGDVAIVDGRSAKTIWETRVEEDDGDPTGLLASPTPLPGPRVGSLLVPTARWGKDDSVVVLRSHYRAYQSRQGRVTGSPVVGVLAGTKDDAEAILGTQGGDVVSFDSTGGVTFLYHLEGAIEASPLIADLQRDGARELVVATTDGKVYALGLDSTTPPIMGRARGESPRNTGLMPPSDLAWKLP